MGPPLENSPAVPHCETWSDHRPQLLQPWGSSLWSGPWSLLSSHSVHNTLISTELSHWTQNTIVVPSGFRTCRCPLEGHPSLKSRRPWPRPQPILLGTRECQGPQPWGLSIGLWLLIQLPMPRANNHSGCKKVPASVIWQVCVCVCVCEWAGVCVCVCERNRQVCICMKWEGVCVCEMGR